MKTEALLLHEKLKGKIELVNKIPVTKKEDLSLLYSPGVADPCLDIVANDARVYDLTWKGNVVAIVSDGSAVLGLGNIGAHAALPVMEGKSMLFKAFADIDSVPLVLNTQNPDEIIQICKALEPSFGGINLEDIKAPECVYIERELKKSLSIPVFHDDQHGTAIVVMSGLLNACKLTGRDLKQCRVVVSGTGAAGSSIIKMLHEYGVSDIYASNVHGMVQQSKKSHYDFVVQELSDIVKDDVDTIDAAFVGADIFVGVSAPNIVSEAMVASMAPDPIIFALANPNPEITYEKAKAAGARVVGTGRSDYPNQVNNVLAFPGIFKGALACRAHDITESMKWAAAKAIAGLVVGDLSDTNILPDAMHPDLATRVAEAVMHDYLEQGGSDENNQ